MGPAAEGAGLLGIVPYVPPASPVRGSSEEVDAESARRPRKRKVSDDEGCQDPTAKKPKPAEEESSEEQLPRRWQDDYTWDRPVFFLPRPKFPL